jgi:hypothetical protein
MIFASLVAALVGRWSEPRQAASLLVAVTIWVLGAMPALAHHAPSGFAYPAECCKGTDMGGDCKPIPSDAVHANSDGSYTIVASKEVFYEPGFAPIVQSFSPGGSMTSVHGREWRLSPDGQFHRCFMDVNEPAAGTYCLYVVPPGV